MKTYSAKPTDINRQWYVMDAAETTLGRLSTHAAKLLIGKGKPQYTNHIDVGDYIVIINAERLKVTGNKFDTKSYYRHSGYPGNLRESKLKEKLANNSTQVIELAIRGMLPVNKLRPARLARLKIYPGNEHNHEAQKPTIISLRKKL